MTDCLKSLCALDGVSGCEDAVADYIINEIKPYAECYIDSLGNVIAHKKGAKAGKKRVLFDAHMDEVGLIITSVREDGFLTFSCVGGINTEALLARRVKIGRIYGVICVKPVHMLTGDEKNKLPDKESLVISIGADNKADAEKYVLVGDTAVFDSDFVEFGDNRIKAKALDDRVGCAIMIDLIKSNLPYDAWFSFSVQEEVGLRGARVSAYTVEPDFAIALESTTAVDTPDMPEHKTVCKLGNGVTVSFMDGATVYDRTLFDAAKSTADECGANIQIKRGTSGGNDAGAIHLSRGGVKTLTLSVPCRYLHTAECVIDIRDADSARKLAFALHEKAAGGKL